MRKAHNPESVAPPVGAYSHGIEVSPGCRWLYLAGQVGIAPDGEIPPDIEGQTEIAWSNIVQTLNASEMELNDIVRTTVYLTSETLIPAYRSARAAFSPDPPPAATLTIVAGLADPRLLVEIEAVAARSA